MKQLWVGRRFQLNERGHYEASSKSQGERVSVEIDGKAHSVSEAGGLKEMTGTRGQTAYGLT